MNMARFYKYMDGVEEKYKKEIKIPINHDPDCTLQLFTGEFARKGVITFQHENYKRYKNKTCAYSDRLWQWDHKKFDAACEKIWGNRGQYFNERTPTEIGKFLSEYYGRKCQILRVIQYENHATGYPVWYFEWKMRK